MKKNQNKTVYNTFNLWKRDESKKFTKRLAWFCASRSGRHSEILCNFISSDDFEALCTYSISYNDNDNVRELAYARQCLAFYSKNVDVDYGQNKELAFIRSFADTERRCGLTNKRFSSLFQSGHLMFCENSLVFDVSRKITEILGDCPSLSELDFRFGPGLNVGLSDASNTSARAKLNAELTCSLDFSDELLEKLAAELPSWFLCNYVEKSAVGKLTSVPKNAKTNRSIIIEGILNTFVQLGVGTYLKGRLKRFGIDLKDQSKNRRLAYLGSIHNNFATIDLSNASNTMALMVVFHLVQSEDWFNLLNQSRTSTVKYKNKSFELEMFSSMGNGFTFELESLIFYAIAFVVVKNCGGNTDLISVFGDDIIVPTSVGDDVAANLTAALTFFGFSVNDDKSFVEGPFRESCGHDYFFGQNIRPFYVKDRWCDARLVGLLNFDNDHYDLFSDIRLDLEIYLASKGVNHGPAGFGDGHLHLRHYDPDLKKILRAPSQVQRKRKDDTWTPLKAPFYFYTVIKVPKRDITPLEVGDILYPLYSIYRKGNDRPQYVISYDSSKIKKTMLNVVVSKETAMESDPFNIRGGWKTKVVQVPLFG